ncbi:MAG: ZIP family metal transporter [Bacillota bacterium]|uniref:Zinc transporter n=1 Tax=Cytobacillus oceanisediminis 2691 TaxID=1196031 RepID=A0A160MHS6_9BACI|nr:MULTISPECIES: ZIP family metal transporter [Bacillaceae]AND42920.1 zinc transporter [Cytobacillus oceanisediminis 2691]MBN8202721.1 ZIP family metal transporter [Bacillus sp. NTK034]MCM3244709.1 ZIP family metal transporter [Cytobacillus oceanisediminis]UQX56934.1 ZIP family metal transporter [Cytobacillus pseudoceanisediminis]USK47438.1 ZIP family metal transporter [Cytobacillus oceanisediminis]
MNSDLAVIVNVFLIIFFGTLIGGGLTWLICHTLKLNSHYINIFCSGILIGLIGFELLPETLKHLDFIGVFAGISLGVFSMIAMEGLIHKTKNRFKRDSGMFLLLFTALFLHSIPTGLAFGMNVQQQVVNPSILLAAVFLHHIPEGVILMGTLIYTEMNLFIFGVFCFILSLAVSLNALGGLEWQSPSEKFTTILNGTAIGTLSYVTIYEVLWKHSFHLSKIKVLSITLLGALLIILFFILVPIGH